MTEPRPPRPAAGGRSAEPRLDQVLAVLLGRQVEALFTGIGVAAFLDDAAPGPGEACPGWLVEDLEITMRLARLAYAAGLDLPAAFDAVALSEHPGAARAHLIGGRSRYQAIGEVLGQLISRGDIPDSLLPDATRLIRETRDQQNRS